MRKLFFLALTLGTVLAMGGCRAFTDLQDLALSRNSFKPGEKAEVKIGLNGRGMEAIDDFTVELEAPPDITITPTRIVFKNAKPTPATITIEVTADASEGDKHIKVHSTPAKAKVTDLTLSVRKHAPSDSIPMNPKEERDAEWNKLAGRYRVQKVTTAGQDSRLGDDKHQLIWEFAADGHGSMFPDGEPTTGDDTMKTVEFRDIMIEPGLSPKEISITIDGVQGYGIYSLSGDDLTIGFTNDRSLSRPKDLTGAGKDDVVWHLKRRK